MPLPKAVAGDLWKRGQEQRRVALVGMYFIFYRLSVDGKLIGECFEDWNRWEAGAELARGKV